MDIEKLDEFELYGSWHKMDCWKIGFSIRNADKSRDLSPRWLKSRDRSDFENILIYSRSNMKLICLVVASEGGNLLSSLRILDLSDNSIESLSVENDDNGTNSNFISQLFFCQILT